jgi:hypothetical protein
VAIDPGEKLISDDLLSRQVASMLALGANTREIAEKLHCSWDKAKKIAQSDLTKSLVKEIGEVAVAAAKAQIKQRLAKLSDEVMAAITAQLQFAAEHPEKGHTDIIKVVLKGLGFQDQEEKGSGHTQINVVMPPSLSSPKKADIDVTPEST